MQSSLLSVDLFAAAAAKTTEATQMEPATKRKRLFNLDLFGRFGLLTSLAKYNNGQTERNRRNVKRHKPN